MVKAKRKRIFFGVAGVCVNDKGEVLITQRHEPKKPMIHHKWQLPGGGIEFGETTEETVKRELLEEIGCQVKIIKLVPYIGTHVYEYKNPVQVVFATYICKIVSGKANNKHYETAAVKWIKPEKIDFSQCLPLLKEILQAAELLKK